MSLLTRELSLALLETLFDAGPVGLAFLDDELRYVRVSATFAQITGIPPDEHVGRTPWEVVPDLAPEVVEHMRTALEEGVPSTRDVVDETPFQPGAQRTLRSQCSWYPVREGSETVGLAALVLETTDATSAAEQRAGLFELERHARERAQDAERRAEFLAEAGTLLDSSLDLATTLRTLSRIVVPHLADLCIIDMLEGEGDVRRVAVAHAQPEAEKLVWELSERWPSALGAGLEIRRVMESGELELISDLTESVLVAAFPDPPHRAQILSLNLRATVIVPLCARGRTLGAITFVRTGERDAFATNDLSLARDLARRASLAVDNARLHTDLRRAGRAQRFLSEATRALAASLDLETTARTVARLAIEGIADGCAVEVVEPSGKLRTLAVAHVQPAKRDAVAQMLTRWPARGEDSAVARAIRSEEAQLVREWDAEQVREPAGEQLAWLAEMGLASLIVVPLVARGRKLGALSLMITESDRRFDEDDLALAEELGRRAAVAGDNARLYSERSRVARTLQKSLVPAALPAVPGIELAARFRAAGDDVEVGGDFYDVWELPDGRWGAVVGDVCGKGAGAAAVTALARHSVRTSSRYEPGPAGVLMMLDRTLSEEGEEGQFCTAAHLWLEPGAGRLGLRYALGGHLPPLVVRAGGAVEALDAPGALLGVWAAPALSERETELGAGDAVVLYTDGVTEAGAPDEPFGERRLASLLAGLAGAGAEKIASAVEDAAVAHRPEPPRDDIAVLVLAVPAV